MTDMRKKMRFAVLVAYESRENRLSISSPETDEKNLGNNTRLP
jgi:hypothetical protein